LIDTKRVWVIWFLQITWISFYKDGEFVTKIEIASLENGNIKLNRKLRPV
jgi:hypothetical protein